MILLCFSWSSLVSFSYPIQELGGKKCFRHFTFCCSGVLIFAVLLSNFYHKWVRKWKRDSSGLCSKDAFHSHKQLLCFHPLPESEFVIIHL